MSDILDTAIAALGVSQAEKDAYFVPSKRGRPPKTISLKELERLCRLMATDEEIAAFFDVDVRTIERRKKNKAFAAAMNRGRKMALLSLRRAQFRTALGGGKEGATLQIWLGKQYLGQKDKLVTEHTGTNGAPIEIADVRTKLADLIARRTPARAADEGHREAES